MCIEDMAIGRHVTPKGSLLDTSGGAGMLNGNPRRVGVLLTLFNNLDTVTVAAMVPGVAAPVPIWIGAANNAATTDAIGDAQFFLSLAEHGLLVTYPLSIVSTQGAVGVVELIADDELDAKINDHWDRMWRTTGG